MISTLSDPLPQDPEVLHPLEDVCPRCNLVFWRASGVEVMDTAPWTRGAILRLICNDCWRSI